MYPYRVCARERASMDEVSTQDKRRYMQHECLNDEPINGTPFRFDATMFGVQPDEIPIGV